MRESVLVTTRSATGAYVSSSKDELFVESISPTPDGTVADAVLESFVAPVTWASGSTVPV